MNEELCYSADRANTFGNMLGPINAQLGNVSYVLCAIVGTSLSLYSLKKHNVLETVCYVLMGLTIVVAMKQFYNAVPLRVFLWVVGEGVAYITGAVFYSFHKVKYIHTVFHFFVLLGTACHMIAMWYVINGM